MCLAAYVCDCFHLSCCFLLRLTARSLGGLGYHEGLGESRSGCHSANPAPRLVDSEVPVCSGFCATVWFSDQCVSQRTCATASICRFVSCFASLFALWGVWDTTKDLVRVGLAVTARILHLGLSIVKFQFARVSERQSGMEPQHRFDCFSILIFRTSCHVVVRAVFRCLLRVQLGVFVL